MTKACTRCKIEKDEAKFYRDRSKKGNLSSWCKSCIKKKQQTERGREAARKRTAKYGQTKRGKETQRKKDEKRKKAFPEKVKAYRAVKEALKIGRLFKKSCPCGETKVEGHHEDYSKPLEVDWLCRKCHLELHRKEKK